MPFKNNEEYRKWKREWYQKNKEKEKNRLKQYAIDKAKFVDEYKQKHGCYFCKETDPIVLDFHHLDDETKEYSISRKTRHYSISRLKKEIEKCIVVCSNCHRKIHAGKINI